MGPMCAPYPCSSDREPATTQHRKLPDGIRRRPLLSVNEPYLTTHSRDISLQLSCSDTRFWSGTETMTNARESFMPVLGPDIDTNCSRRAAKGFSRCWESALRA